MKKSVWIAIVVVIAVMLIVVRVKRVKEKEDAPLIPDVAVAVETATVGSGEVVATRHVLGKVFGANEATVAPRVMAQVMSIKVREGDLVKQGDLVAELDSRELSDGVSQAEAGVLAAQSGLTAASTAETAQSEATARSQRLHEAKAISDGQWERSQAAAAAAVAHLEAARAQVEIAEKRLNQAQIRMTYCHLTAPVTGVVARRMADPGDLGVPGKPLLEIVRQSSVRVRAEVPSEDLASLVIGQKVSLLLGESKIETTISRVFPAMGKSHLAAFEVDLPSPPPGIVSGATVGVDVHLNSAEGLRVPADALLEGENGSWVFVVEGGTVHPVRVEVLGRSLTKAVISGDISEGDSVVVARPSRLMTLTDGVKVRTMAAID